MQVHQQLTEKFFRREYSKMVATLVKFLGPHSIALAEDMVQDTLLEAMKNWEYQGVPHNPQAWLYRVARNKTYNYLKQESNRGRLRAQALDIEEPYWPEPEFEDILKDQQLTMMFVCCHPAIPQTSQIALVLKTLCGLSIAEIAKAFLSNSETINKRLVRARKALRDHKIAFELPPKDFSSERLDTVLKMLLLLFNEGYSTSQGDQLLKEEFCQEAIRLAELILKSQYFTDNSDVHALLALMYFNISRFPSRSSKEGLLVELASQDRSQWNSLFIQQGLQHLEEILDSEKLSFYKITAAIAAYHSTAPDYRNTDWPAILGLYDILEELDKSPLVKINRAVALAQVKGYKEGLSVLSAIQMKKVANYHYYFAVKGEFNLKLEAYSKARKCFEKALDLTASEPERKHLLQKLALC